MESISRKPLKRRRVLERMGRVGVEEAAAIGAQLLDGDLRGGRADGDGLLVSGTLSITGLPAASLSGLPLASVLACW